MEQGMMYHRARSWSVLLVFGIIAILAGLVAMFAPLSSQIMFIMIMGMMLFVAGIVQIAHAIRSAHSARSVILGVLGAIFYFIAGFLLLTFPMQGVLLATIVLGVLFVLEGIVQLGTGLEESHRSGWGWLVAGGIVAFILGILILATLSTAQTWLLGFTLGVCLVFYGISIIIESTELRQIDEILRLREMEKEDRAA